MIQTRKFLLWTAEHTPLFFYYLLGDLIDLLVFNSNFSSISAILWREQILTGWFENKVLIDLKKTTKKHGKHYTEHTNPHFLAVWMKLIRTKHSFLVIIIQNETYISIVMNEQMVCIIHHCSDQWEGLYYTSMDSIHTTN